jgi:signal transduction histidine kinase
MIACSILKDVGSGRDGLRVTIMANVADGAMGQRSLRAWVWSGAAVAVVLMASGLLLSLLAIAASSGQIGPKSHQFFEPLITLSFCLVGALIVSRRPSNVIGWMLGLTGVLTGLDLLALGYSLCSLTLNESLPGAQVARWLDGWIWVLPLAVPLTFVVLLFPDGRLVSRRWRPIAWLAGVGLAAAVLGLAIDPSLLAPPGNTPAQFPTRAQAASVLQSVAWPLLLVGFLGSLTSLVVRFRRTSGREHDQVKWLVYGVALGLLIAVLGNVLPIAFGVDGVEELSIIGSDVALISMILAVGIAIVRHRLYDIDLLINRTLVYSVLTALIVTMYVLTVGSLGALFQVRGSLSVSLVATGVVAVCFQPLRDWLQRATNRLMYGERDNPYAVLSRLGKRLEEAVAADAILETLVETVAQSLKLPYAAIVLGAQEEPRTAATYGQPAAEPEQFALIFQGEIIGQLLVGPRAFGETFNESERTLLANIARQAGAAVHAARLTVDLQRSRVQLVTAREEERRRLRRDLHDGFGPTLAALHLQTGALRRLIRSKPEAAEVLIDDVQTEMRGLLDAIRQLAYALRPPSLDELGLAGAIQGRAANMSQCDNGEWAHSGVRIQVEAPHLAPLPAAVEVAAYHIVQEALLNVVRHAQAADCTVRLELADDSDGLCIEIVDNGDGLPVYHAGVGIVSMRERATELGGWCTIQSRPGGGTIVRACLPISEG